jgi:hypothetical protein
VGNEEQRAEERVHGLCALSWLIEKIVEEMKCDGIMKFSFGMNFFAVEIAFLLVFPRKLWLNWALYMIKWTSPFSIFLFCLLETHVLEWFELLRMEINEVSLLN